MKAIIMAGGEGKRLRPLTCDLPKPLVPLMGKPVLEHILLLLKRNGITEVCITLGYMADKIREAVGDGRQWGMHIECVVERSPLGTAGGVKACKDFLGTENFLVLSGDGMMDFSIIPCIERHDALKAEASVILCHRHCPLPYGVVATDEAGWIRHFEEKPTWKRVCSDLVNTGVYIFSNCVLDDIPENRPWDFGRDFFPAMIRKNKKILGIPATGYWCDIGTPKAYHQCCMDLLQGAVASVAVPNVEQYRKKYGSKVSLFPPLWLADGVAIEDRATVGPGAMLGAGTVVGQGATVKNTVIWQGAIGENAFVSGSICMDNIRIGARTHIGENTVLGKNTSIQPGSVVSSDTVLWPSGTERQKSHRKIRIPEGEGNRLLRKLAEKLGFELCNDQNAVELEWLQSGSIKVTDETGAEISLTDLQELGIYSLFQQGIRQFYVEPEKIELIAFLEKLGAQAVYDDPEEKNRLSQRFLRDEFFAAEKMLRIMKQSDKELWQLLRELPTVYCREAEVPAMRGRAELMGYFSKMAGKNPKFGFGIAFSEGKGTTWIIPRTDREAIHIVAFAGKAEIAEEMCSFYKNKAKENGGSVKM